MTPLLRRQVVKAPELAGIVCLAVSLIGGLPGCGERGQGTVDLPQIRERGRLIAITGYDANSYFIYKGRPMGYEYELLTRLADHLGLRLEMNVVRDRDDLLPMLERGEGDILAANLTVTKERADRYQFTDFLMTTRQVLVQRKPENWRMMKLHEIESQLIRNPIGLAGREVHVRRETSYYPRLQNLSEEIGSDIRIVEEPGDVSTDELIRRVAVGEIEFTVADENIALINQAYYPDIDVETAISFPQRIAWITRPGAPELLDTVNSWIGEEKKGSDYYVIYRKYYQNPRGFRDRLASEIYTHGGGKLSPFDGLIREQAKIIGWDWRLLASMVYQESLFDPDATSWAGAVGLMQLLPETAADFGVTNIDDPAQNLAAGVRYLKWLDDFWSDIQDPIERQKFVLASYNVGYGHVEDARRLAAEMSGKSGNWDKDVVPFMLELSNQDFYTAEVVRNGYCRGEEPVNYVEQIMDRYDHYKNFIDRGV